MSAIRFADRFFPDDLKATAETLLPKSRAALAAIEAKSCAGSEWTGWFDWPRERGQTLKKAILRYKDDLDVYYDLVLVIGIGGSYLGTRAVVDTLSHTYAGMGSRELSPAPLVVYAGHEISEASLIEVLDLLEDKQPLVNVISKSGTTTEPGVAFRIVRSYMEKRFGKAEAAKRIIATTDPDKGALRRLAKEAGYQIFDVPSDVGGRYSVLTAVGLVPLALAGFDIEALLNGADDEFTQMREKTALDHPVLHYAASRNAAYQAGKRIEILAYAEPRMHSLVEWWKQLFGESEGKDGKGLFPAGMAYTTDLHSLGQYAQDGVRNLLETFVVTDEAPYSKSSKIERRLRVPAAGDVDELGYLEGRFVGEINQKAMLATMVAHHDGGVPCLELGVNQLNERTVGSLFAFFETACAISGALLGVNPFDQPGVEAYKKNLFGLLGKPGFEALGAELKKRF